jgi:HNH endonuclease
MTMWNTDLTLDPDNLLNDLNNVILLRPDLHAAFDDRKFVLYPKADDGYVVHMLEPTPDIGQLYHNVKTHPLLQCNPRFLYARFAWALFPSLAGFLSKPGVSRYLFLARKGERGVEWVEEEVAKPEELRARISASRSRSPKKRQRATNVNPHEDVETDGLPEISLKRQRGSISMTADWKKATSAGLEDHVLIYQPESTAQVCEDELARIELEEDMELQRRHIDLASSAMPPSWYPGWRQIQRLKVKWITHGRLKNSPDWQTEAGIGRCLSNEGVVDRVRGFYKAMGYDSTDDDDTIQYGDSQFPLTY